MKWLKRLFKKKQAKCDEELIYIHKICIGLLSEASEKEKSYFLVRIENQIKRMIEIAKTKEEHEKIEEIVRLTLDKYKGAVIVMNKEENIDENI